VNHLEEARILALGLEPEATPSATEAAHLAECPGCAARLEEEQTLTAELEELPLLEPSLDFVAKTTARYVEAVDGRRGRRMAWLIVAALCLAPAVLVPMVGILVANAGAVLTVLAQSVGYVVTVGHALFIVVAKLPQVTVAMLFMVGTAALASSLVIGRLAVVTAPAK
jgi:hypothetical protein